MSISTPIYCKASKKNPMSGIFQSGETVYVECGISYSLEDESKTVWSEIEYSIDSGSTWKSPPLTSDYFSATLTLGNDFDYIMFRARGTDTVNYSDWVYSSSYPYSSNTPPDAPTNLLVSGSLRVGETVNLSWDAVVGSNIEYVVVARGSLVNGFKYRETLVDITSSLSINYTLPSDDKFGFFVYARSKTTKLDSPTTAYSSQTVTESATATMTTPTDFEIPSPIYEGDTITLWWGVSKTTSGSFASGYILEKSVDSGKTWSEIYDSNMIYTTDTIVTGTTTVMYRVMAYHNDGDTSDYLISEEIPVLKLETAIELMYKTASSSETRPTMGKLTVEKEIPSGAAFSAEVCNNGFDSSPTWEDVTSYVEGNIAFCIQNESKTNSKWGFNTRIIVERNNAIGDCYISKVQSYFK